jgi:hypothetical protein
MDLNEFSTWVEITSKVLAHRCVLQKVEMIERRKLKINKLFKVELRIDKLNF